MSGRILLVDDVSTSRIILKVKLSAAYYDVPQASGIDEAVACLEEVRPDLILISGRLVHNELSKTIARLKPDADGPATPIILMTDETDKSFRIKALRAGFDDVLSTPAQENYLLARLRSLLRQRHHTQDLRKHSVAARALGFAENQQGFSRPATITLVTDNPVSGLHLRNALSQVLPHKFHCIGAENLMGPEARLDGPRTQSDMLIADLREKSNDDGLRFIADLRASAIIQDCPVLPLVAKGSEDLGATLLDMGVCEVLFDESDPQETALRLSAQLDQKWASDTMRDQIKDSLQAAVTDPLTGLYNRRYALSYLKCLVSTEDRADQTFAVMVADLDHFKQINDSYGHAAGDMVLARVANTLCNHLHGKDLVARIGGEEFLIIIPETNRLSAHRIAQELCSAIQSMSLTLPGKATPISTTISIGVTLAKASQLSGANSDAQAHELLELADRALYKSKAEGRNMVTLSGRSAA